MTQKRPIGLKAQKEQQNRSQKKVRTEDEPKSFTTVALVPGSGAEDETDGLTFADLIQLKNQADNLIDDPTGLQADDDHLANLLRGICHEAVRQVEIADVGDHDATPVTGLPPKLLSWATLELGMFLSLHQQPDKVSLPDEPKSLQAWLAIAGKALDNFAAGALPEHEHKQAPELKLLPFAISLFKSDSPLEISSAVSQLTNQLPTEAPIYVLRTIDRLLLLRSSIFPQDPTPVFQSLVDCLKQLRSQSNLGTTSNGLFSSIDHRLGDCYLSHGSLLAEQIEDRYYPEVEPNETEEEDEFPIDSEDPTYQLAIQSLRSAVDTFVGLLAGIDDADEAKDKLSSKLEEALLTLGNLLPPGPERETLYLRAGLSHDDEPDA